MSKLPTTDKAEQKTIMEKVADVLGDILDGALETTGSETTLKLNLAVIKVKHTVKKGKKQDLVYPYKLYILIYYKRRINFFMF